MKTSQKTLWATVASLAVAIVCFIGFTRVAISAYEREIDDMVDVPDSAVPLDQLRDFTGIDVSGRSKVHIISGENWQVEIKAEEGRQDLVYAQVVDGRLKLRARSRKGDGEKRQRWFDDNEPRFEANITMPSLESIDAGGRVVLEFSGFDGETLLVDVSGLVSVEGDDSAFVHLTLEAKGATHIDFSEVPSVNAKLDASGASNIELNMVGGELVGKLYGAGNVSYSGVVSRHDIDVSGMGNVERVH